MKGCTEVQKRVDYTPSTSSASGIRVKRGGRYEVHAHINALGIEIDLTIEHRLRIHLTVTPSGESRRILAKQGHSSDASVLNFITPFHSFIQFGDLSLSRLVRLDEGDVVGIVIENVDTWLGTGATFPVFVKTAHLHLVREDN